MLLVLLASLQNRDHQTFNAKPVVRQHCPGTQHPTGSGLECWTSTQIPCRELHQYLAECQHCVIVHTLSHPIPTQNPWSAKDISNNHECLGRTLEKANDITSRAELQNYAEHCRTKKNITISDHQFPNRRQLSFTRSIVTPIRCNSSKCLAAKCGGDPSS